MRDSQTVIRFRRTVQRHPITVFWLLSCAAFAAGIAATPISLLALAVILLLEMAAVSHVVTRGSYDPQKIEQRRRTRTTQQRAE